MESNLCSKVFRDFWNIAYDNTLYPPQMLELLSGAIQPLASEMNIAKISIDFHAPSSVFARGGINKQFDLYNKGLVTGEPIVNEYVTGENGHVVILIYPHKGNEFSPAAIEDVKFLASSIFVLFGRSRLMELVSKASITDAPTGAFNLFFLRQFGKKLEAQGNLANYTAFFINLKNFKYVNKMLGPDRGSRVLQIYVQSAMSFIKKEEIFVRLGGDNFFALILNDRKNEFLNKYVIFPIDEHKTDKDLIVQVMARMGVYQAQPGDTLEDLMTYSSIALGIGRTVLNKDITLFRPEMMERVMYQKKVSSDFPQALKNNEFVLYYQPKINLYDHNLHGAEALVRWVHDDKIIAPMEFINILEKEEAICMLDLFVFEKVCEDLRDWLDDGIRVPRISSNFSKRNLRNPNLANEILGIMRKYNIDSKYIEIEVTEISDYDDISVFEGFINKLKHNGISVAIDDFGTGYSTMNILKKLNVDVIKLDKSLIDNLENPEREDEIVIRNIVNMVNELSIETVAEGVETQAQVKFLKRIHCPIVQGFLFDKPLTHNDFEKRLKDPHYYEDK